MKAKAKRIVEELEKATGAKLRAQERAEDFPVPYDELDWETADEMREELGMTRKEYAAFTRGLRDELRAAETRYNEALQAAVELLEELALGSEEKATLAKEISKFFLAC